MSEQPYGEKEKARRDGVVAVVTVTGLVSYVVTPHNLAFNLGNPGKFPILILKLNMSAKE